MVEGAYCIDGVQAMRRLHRRHAYYSLVPMDLLSKVRRSLAEAAYNRGVELQIGQGARRMQVETQV